MTTLTATPNLTRGTVALRLTVTSPVVSVVRADANGTYPVRVLPGTLPTAGSGEIVIVDYEPSLSGPINYRVDDGAAGAQVWTTLDGVKLPRFILPHLPAFQVIVETVTGHTVDRESRSTIHEVVGSEDPLIILGRLRTRRGTLTIISQDYMAAKDLESMFERGQIVMYRQPENPGLDMYLAVKSLSKVPVADVWETRAEYVEVLRPEGFISTRAGWSFDQLAAEGVSFDQVAQDYRTFWDLTLGEKTL